jgi:hypothetical protein
MLQVGRQRVRDPMRWMNVFNFPNTSRFTQPLTEMSNTRRKIVFLGSRERSVRKADNITAICELIV